MISNKYNFAIIAAGMLVSASAFAQRPIDCKLVVADRGSGAACQFTFDRYGNGSGACFHGLFTSVYKIKVDVAGSHCWRTIKIFNEIADPFADPSGRPGRLPLDRPDLPLNPIDPAVIPSTN